MFPRGCVGLRGAARGCAGLCAGLRVWAGSHLLKSLMCSVAGFALSNRLQDFIKFF